VTTLARTYLSRPSTPCTERHTMISKAPERLSQAHRQVWEVLRHHGGLGAEVARAA